MMKTFALGILALLPNLALAVGSSSSKTTEETLNSTAGTAVVLKKERSLRGTNKVTKEVLQYEAIDNYYEVDGTNQELEKVSYDEDYSRRDNYEKVSDEDYSYNLKDKEVDGEFSKLNVEETDQFQDNPSYACAPITESSCRTAAISQGLQLGGRGYDFAGSYSNKGCYFYKTGTYAGMAYWGGSGTDEQMSGYNFNGDQNRLLPPVCSEPLTESSCRTAAISKDLQLGGRGYDFAGSYSNKGCYFYKTGTYAGMAYWGGIGTDKQMRGDTFNGNQRRLRLPACGEPHILTKSACSAAAISLGLKRGGNGYHFSGSYYTKGCYAYSGGSYAGMAFWGTGGTRQEMENQALDGTKYRLPCKPQQCEGDCDDDLF